MKVYKMFRRDLTCRGYQFHEGLNTCEEANCVKNGFHAAENPLDCLKYYPDWYGSVCWLCEAGGDIDEDGRDSKISCTELTLLRQLGLADYVVAAVDYMVRHPRRPYCERYSGAVQVIREESVKSAYRASYGDNLKGPAVIIRGNSPESIQAGEAKILALVTEDPDTHEICSASVEDRGTGASLFRYRKGGVTP